jgi:hydroxyacylglutathione hydrolase
VFIETVKSPGLAHLSYVLGDAGEAAVVDPRLDLDSYLDLARVRDVRIVTVIETHRNEDYVSGARRLAAATGARLVHGRGIAWGFGEAVADGTELDVGGLRLQVLATPGHTPESVSVAVVHRATGDLPIAVFTGDALFVGDVGRTDLHPDGPEVGARLLYHSLHQRLLPLGDQALVLPAHGAGSVCGGDIAQRDVSTLGYERRCNPRLQLSEGDFVRAKAQELHHRPPYFARMERVNLRGEDRGPDLLAPQPLAPDAFAERMDRGMAVVDVRSPEAICGASVPDALGLPLAMLPSLGGWFVPDDHDLGLVVDRPDDVRVAVAHLGRLGLHRVVGWLRGGVVAWCSSGRDYRSFPTVSAPALKRRLEQGTDAVLLDVRGPEAFDEGHLPGARSIYVGEVGLRAEELPRDRAVLTYCNTGRRSTVAATVLARSGFERVEVALGSISGCREVGCPQTRRRP